MPDALSYGDELIDNMIEAAFLTMGQNCTAGSRVLVHRDIAEEVLERFTAAAGTLGIGDPARAETRIGPLISRAARDRIAAAVLEATAEGARTPSLRDCRTTCTRPAPTTRPPLSPALPKAARS
jgi:gamma-glutamyl-gamma-aminobutyraldehyde dehydrogenase